MAADDWPLKTGSARKLFTTWLFQTIEPPPKNSLTLPSQTYGASSATCFWAAVHAVISCVCGVPLVRSLTQVCTVGLEYIAQLLAAVSLLTQVRSESAGVGWSGAKVAVPNHDICAIVCDS